MPGGVIISPGTAEERRIKPLSDGTVVKKGDLIRIITPGGGGWGSPLDRPQNDVLDDVLDGYVSIKQAKNQYGVVLSKDGLAIDLYETEKLRSSRPRAPEMFHRGEYYNAEDDRTPQNQ